MYDESNARSQHIKHDHHTHDHNTSNSIITNTGTWSVRGSSRTLSETSWRCSVHEWCHMSGDSTVCLTWSTREASASTRTSSEILCRSSCCTSTVSTLREWRWGVSFSCRWRSISLRWVRTSRLLAWEYDCTPDTEKIDFDSRSQSTILQKELGRLFGWHRT